MDIYFSDNYWADSYWSDIYWGDLDDVVTTASKLLLSLFNNTFEIERRIRTSDGVGGFEISYSSLGYADGRIRPASGREREIAAQEGREISHVLYLAGDEDIARGDRVTVGDLVVEVMGVREPSQAGHHLEVDCLERQKEVTS